MNDCYLSIKDNVLDVLDNEACCHVINVLSLSPVLYTKQRTIRTDKSHRSRGDAGGLYKL